MKWKSIQCGKKIVNKISECSEKRKGVNEIKTKVISEGNKNEDNEGIKKSRRNPRWRKWW